MKPNAEPVGDRLSIVRDPGARTFFLIAAIATVGVYYLTNHMPRGTLTPIFVALFVDQDSWAAIAAVLILIAAVFLSRRLPAEPILRWVGEHPWIIALATFVICCAGTGLIYLNHPLSMDEYTQLFQSKIFAGGHLAGQLPAALLDRLIPEGFQNYFLFVSKQTGAVASAYWPSFALLLTPFSFLGIAWACNPLITAATVLVIHQLTLRIFGDVRAAGLAALLTIASPVFFANGISFYSMPAHLLANALFALLLTDPTPRRVFAAGVVGSVALTLHNPLPHMLFALPWLIWLTGRPEGWRSLIRIACGYAPLCIVLGLGWFWFTNELRQTSVDSAVAATARVEHLQRLGQAFAFPDTTVLWARLIGIAKIWVWAVPGLLLLAAVGGWRRTELPFCRLLLYSALATLIGFVFVPVDQGHGWGYRYFHTAWLALPILAAGAVVAPTDRAGSTSVFANDQVLRLVVSAAVLTLTLGVGLRFWQIHDFISGQLAQMPHYTANGRHVVMMEPRFGYYAWDLIQNDPWLRRDEIRMVTQGNAKDAQVMHEYFPAMQRVYADKYGTVWARPESR